MKRITAAILALSILFLCACSGQNSNNDASTTANQQTESVTKSFSDWGSNLLPSDFPAPPASAYNISIDSGKASDNGYRSDFVRVIFTCFERDIYDFSNKLQANGYVGGIKNIQSHSTYYPEGFLGAWQNGVKLIRVNNAKINETGDITFVFDIIDCIDSFPEPLERLFPKFNGYSKGTGQYYRYNENQEIVSREFEGDFTQDAWYWDFGFENAFIGVTNEQLTEYENILVEEMFGGESSVTVADDCTFITYNLYKEIGGVLYGVFIAYNQTLRMLDIVYTNEPSLITGQEVVRQ